VPEGAERGHLDRDGERGGLADAGDAHQDAEAGAQAGIGGERGVQGRVEGGDPALDPAQALPGVALEERRGGCARGCGRRSCP